jgi:hypothetical protein
MLKNTFIKPIARALIGIIVGVSVVTFGTSVVFAASLTSVSDTMSSLKVSVASNHDIYFVTPTGISTGQTILVTFPSGFVINAALDFSDVDVLVNGVQQTLAASNGASTWGVVRTSATVLTITAQSGGTPAAAGNNVRIRIGTNASNQSTGVRQVANDSTPGTKVVTIGGGTFADTGTASVILVNDDTVSVSATVQQSISFSISTSTIYFGTLSSGSAKYASSTNVSGDGTETIAHTLAVGTNAPSGYSITVLGQTLTSQQNTANTIAFIGASPTASTPGTEQFGIRATKSGGVNGAIGSPFANATNYGYDATATSSSVFASGTTPTNTETYSLRYLANIAALTEAGTYQANLTYVATANF